MVFCWFQLFLDHLTLKYSPIYCTEKVYRIQLSTCGGRKYNNMLLPTTRNNTWRWFLATCLWFIHLLSIISADEMLMLAAFLKLALFAVDGRRRWSRTTSLSSFYRNDDLYHFYIMSLPWVLFIDLWISTYWYRTTETKLGGKSDSPLSSFILFFYDFQWCIQWKVSSLIMSTDFVVFISLFCHWE